ncbi:MAG: S9 family peptidase [Candidatus Eremiobacteraeota bacterium]|nr:S9 family peptidase [Candidatus Eremiobacteraeota bacterium]
MNARLILAAILVALLPVSAHAAGRPIRAEDLFKISYVGAPQISPDGKYVVYVVSKMNGPDDRYDTNLWLTDVASGNSTQITKTRHDSRPTWSPDSKVIAFVRSMPKAKSQIYTYALSSKKITRITNMKTGADSPNYSNNGKMIAYSSTTTDERPGAQIDFAAAGFKPKKNQKKSDVRQIDTMHFQANGAGEVYQYHQHIWVMNADGSKQRALTSGNQWTENGASWSPDDKTIAFNSLRRDDPYGGPNDIYTIPVDGGTMQKMAETQVANDLIGFGHHSNRLWYFAHDVRDPAESPSLVSSNPDGSDTKQLVAKNTIAWGDSLIADMKEGGGLCYNMTPDDKSIILNLDGPGYAHLVKMSASEGTMTDLTGPQGEAYGCTASADGKTIAYNYADWSHPQEIYVVSADNPKPRALTSFNAEYLKSVTVSKPQMFTVKDALGYEVQAWFLPAVGPKSGPRPTILDIHGGPETQFGDTFFHELQFLAGLGYNVVYSDPRGSTGHGYAFEEALVHHWGDAMLDDTNLVMDQVIKRPDVDSNRLGVSGGSYGGYATLWTISHSDRYKAAIAERVVSNLMSENLTADFASTNGLGGPYDWGMPWDANNTLMAQSPLTYANKVHTPLLILHGTEDTRTPFSETMQEFAALKILGATVHYVEFPGENHDLSRTGSPLHRVERLRISGDWLGRYLKP